MSVLEDIMAVARKRGIPQAELARHAGVHPGSLSRALASGRCQLATVEALAQSVGLRIVCVADSDAAERLVKGELF